MNHPDHAERHQTHPHAGPARSERATAEHAHRARHQRARFRVEGLASSFDAARLEHRLERQVGVIGATVNSIAQCAYVAYDPALTSPSMLARQIEVSGFHVKA